MLCIWKLYRPGRPTRRASPVRAGIFHNEGFEMVAKAKTEYVVDAAGLVIGNKFIFADGTVRRIMNDELPSAVAAHATANGIREGVRDTYADADTVAEAIACFDKRKHTMVVLGMYAARGGGSLDWVGDIMDAVAILDPTMTEDVAAARRADLEAKGLDELKAWLKARKPIAAQVDAIRTARKAARAKAAVKTNATLNW